MNNLLIILLFIFGGVGLMVVLGERFAKPADSQRMARLSRWIWPLLGVLFVVSVLDYYVL